jgi:hypothetical protein
MTMIIALFLCFSTDKMRKQAYGESICLSPWEVEREKYEKSEE